MKKRIFVLILIIIAILSTYIYSSARNKIKLPKPEDMAGEEASAFMPRKVDDKPAPKGSAEMKITGPVWVEE